MISDVQYLDDLTFVSVTDTGYSHIKNSIPNQDAVQFLYDKGDYVLTVADGVGSCAYADIGSKLAVSAAVRAFNAVRNSLIMFNEEAIVSFILKEWQNLINGNQNDYCTTLKTVIKIADSLLFVSIGDGIIAFSSGEQSYILQDNDNAFLNQTKCFNECTQISDFNTCILKLDPDISYAIVAATDGVSNFIQNGLEVEFVREIETNLNISDLKEELMKFVYDIAEYSSDDRTVGVIKYEGKNAGSKRKNNYNS